jgi:hypothetical protein
MFAGEKTKRKNDAPRSRRYVALGLIVALVMLFSAALLMQSLLVLPDPTGHIYYGYTIDPTTDVTLRHSFDGVSSAHSFNRPVPTLPSEATPRAPEHPFDVVWRDVEDDLMDELVVRDSATKEDIRVLGRFYNNMYNGSINISPDEQWVAFTAYNEFVPWNKSEDYTRDLWLARIDTGEIKRLTETAYDEYAPSFTPDGASLLYISWADQSPRLYQRDLATDTVRLLTPDLNVQYYIWSPDKQMLIFKTYDPSATVQFHQPPAGALYKMYPASGAFTPLIAEPVVYIATWSPDGQWIAFTTYDPIETLEQRTETSWGYHGNPYYEELPSTLWLMRPDGSDRHAIDTSRFPLEGVYWKP